MAIQRYQAIAPPVNVEGLNVYIYNELLRVTSTLTSVEEELDKFYNGTVLVLTTPNGNDTYSVTIDNSGNLVTTEL